MNATSVLILILGDVALLLWGMHTVRQAVLHAFGSDLKRVLGRALDSRLTALGAGLGVTLVLQSSTATALMVASFAGVGAVTLIPGLAMMLGANIGTSLVTQVISLDLSLAFAVFLVAGFALTRLARTARMRDIGRAGVGLGVMLLALRLLAETISPASGNQEVHELFRFFMSDPFINLVLAAAIAWAAHASLVAVLFVAQFAASGIIDPQVALAMVLGANLGGAINPVLEMLGGGSARLRVPVGNLITRLAGAAVVFAALGPVTDLLLRVDPDPARFAVNAHVALNVALAIVFLPALSPLARLLVWLMPEQPAADDPSRPRYLGGSEPVEPAVALTNAAREVLRMADVAEEMLRGSRAVFQIDDRERVSAVSRMDDVLDGLCRAINRYLAAVRREQLPEADARRLSEILVFAINLEHIGDIIDKSLMELAEKRIRLQLRLADEAAEEIEEIHDRLLEHLHLAVSVFLCGDTRAARRLVEEKEHFRAIERTATQRFFDRVGDGEPSTVATIGLELDIVRDLKRIEAHIAATAYPLLEATGDLKPTRLAS